MAAVSSYKIRDVCQRYQSLKGRRAIDRDDVQLTKSTLTRITYVVGVAFVFVASWVAVNFRYLSSITGITLETSQHHEILSFGERNLRFSAVPKNVQTTSETEPG